MSAVCAVLSTRQTNGVCCQTPPDWVALLHFVCLQVEYGLKV